MTLRISLTALLAASIVACSSTAPSTEDTPDASTTTPPAPSVSATSNVPEAGAPDAPVAVDAGSDAAEAGAEKPSTTDCSKLTVTGDPTSNAGATWTYTSTDDGVAYALSGVLLAPQGAGPFPAVVVSHGKGGAATGYSRNVGVTMRGWGMVAIATGYSHGVMPSGAPLGADGASPENLARAYKARLLLQCVPSVDLRRVAAHGHSMGAFVTAGLLAAHGSLFVAASHTAGGIREAGQPAGPSPTVTEANRIRVPYQLHHGDLDTVVALGMDRLLAQTLTANGVRNELLVYPGLDHDDVPLDATVLSRVRAFYMDVGVLR